jgi:O-antigen/teichoic acid export membrane protein
MTGDMSESTAPGGDEAEVSRVGGLTYARAGRFAEEIIGGDALRSRTLRSSIWTTGGYASFMVLRFGSNLVLTRLLVPEMFGLMTLVNMFMQGLQMFSDVGVGPAIIQNERGDERRFLNTAWTIQVMRGATLFLCAAILSAPLAHIYNQPEMKWLLPVAAITALIAGFNSTAVFRLNRHLQLGKLTLLELATQVITICGMIGWAAVDRSIWALVVPGIFGRLFYMVVSHLLLIPGTRNRFDWDATAYSALLRFGKWIFLSTVLTFLANGADRLILGKMMPMGLFGVYGIAAMLAGMPTQVITKIGASVAFPAYSRVKDDRRRFDRVFCKIRTPLLLLGACACTMLIACGPTLIALLYDERYQAAGWILPLIAIEEWFQIMECTNGSALLAHGRTHWIAAATGMKFLGILVMLPLGFAIGHHIRGNELDGFAGAIAGVAASESLRYLVSAVGVRGLGLKVVRTDMLICLAIGAAVAITLLSGHSIPMIQRRQLVVFVQSVAIVLLLWVPIALWQWRRLITSKQPAHAM